MTGRSWRSTRNSANSGWDADGKPELLFCENETNARRLYGQADATGRFKDAFHDYVVQGQRDAVNPGRQRHEGGRSLRIGGPAGGAESVRLRLRPSIDGAATDGGPAFDDFDAIFAARAREADEFYGQLQRDIGDADARLVQRQAFAGMIWSKQCYHYDVPEWLNGDPAQPPPPAERKHGRNRDWTAPQQRRHHLDAGQVGIPVVCGVGPGVSLHPARAGRRGVRQAPTRAAHARMVHASERPVARLRMGVRRRKPAGSRLGDVARVPDRPQAARRGRAISPFSSACSTSCCSTSPGG